MSGLRKTVPTSFGVPSGSRKSAAEAGTSSKKSTFACVWSKKVLVDHEAFARDPDRGLQRLRERDRPVAVERLGPAGDRAGDADGEAAVAGRREGERRPVLPERVGAHRRRTGLAVVDRGDRAAGGPEQQEAATADSARERLGDAEHRGGGDRGVDGVAAAAKRVDRRLGRERLHGGGGAARAGCRRWPGRRGRRGGGAGEREDGQGASQ